MTSSIQSLRLVPVVSFDPALVTGQPLPASSPRQSHAAWLAALASAGIRDLLPVMVPSTLVRLESMLKEPVLSLRVDLALGLKDGARPSTEQRDALLRDLGPLAGGLALEVDDALVSLPGCCAGLDALLDWEEARVVQGWVRPFNGHQSSLLQWCHHPGDMVELVVEQSRLVDDDMAWWTFPRALLDGAVAEARKALHRLEGMMTPHLADVLGAEMAPQAAALLAGLRRAPE